VAASEYACFMISETDQLTFMSVALVSNEAVSFFDEF
jgi:hypothetical protein